MKYTSINFNINTFRQCYVGKVDGFKISDALECQFVVVMRLYGLYPTFSVFLAINHGG